MSYNEGEILKIYCPDCKEMVEPIYNEVIFKNKTKHIEARCPDCNLFFQYIQQSNNDIIYFGKYKGQNIGDISLKDKQYLLWLLEQPFCKNNLKNKIKKYI